MDEKREWPRFCPTQPTEIPFNDSAGVDRLARLLNESVGGAALSCQTECVVIPGTVVALAYRGALTQAIVWHSRAGAAGETVFGVEWLE